MKLVKMSVLVTIISCWLIGSANYANAYDDYMDNHPSYNQNYYNPNYNSSDSTPNYNSNYYNRTYNYNNSFSNGSNDAPHGNDIRDYNPYYDRNGNLK